MQRIAAPKPQPWALVREGLSAATSRRFFHIELAIIELQARLARHEYRFERELPELVDLGGEA